MKHLVTIFVLAITYAFTPCSASGLDVPASETGMETNHYRNVAVLVHDLDENATQLGLTKILIQAHINVLLRNNGLEPEIWDGQPNILYCTVQVVNEYYYIHLTYNRFVTYEASEELLHRMSSTWNTVQVGYHELSSENLLLSLDQMTVTFIQKYLSTNMKAE